MSYYGKTQSDMKFVPVSKAEERQLFRVFYAFRPQRVNGFPKYSKRPVGVERKSLAARDRIIDLYVLLVVKLSLMFARGRMPDDLAISTGNFALIKLLESRRFRPSKGKRFPSYLNKYIKGAIARALRDTFKHDGSNRLRVDLHGPESLLPPEIITHITIQETEREIDNDERADIIKSAMKGLSPAQRRAVVGISDGKTFEEIGEEMGVSRQCVHQDFAKAKKILIPLFNHEPLKESYELRNAAASARALSK